MNLMVFNWFFYSQHIYGIADNAGNKADVTGSMLTSVFAYLMLVLCTMVMVLVGSPIIADVIDRLRQSRGRNFDMNLLIIVGVGAAYAISAIHTFQGQGHLYFDTAALILVLVTLGGYLDARAKQHASVAGNELLDLLPATVQVRRDCQLQTISAGEVKVGDHVQACPGERIAVDGMISYGASDVDESAITGESKPRATQAGDSVMAGAIAIDGQLWIQAQRVGEHRMIEQIKQMLDEARRQQPQIQRLADRVATAFIPVVMLLALAVFVVVTLQTNVEAGLFRSLSVLLISCPCALGLAAPLATSMAMTRAARRGILFKSAHVLEQAASVRTIFFDKTGTLTDPHLTIESIEPREGMPAEQALQIAASMESGSGHPIAQSLCDAARERAINLESSNNVKVLPGQGITASLDDRDFSIGNHAMLKAKGWDVSVNISSDSSKNDSNACIPVYLLDDSGVVCVFQLAETVKLKTRETLEQLRQSKFRIEVLTGDASGPASKLAESLGIPVHSRLLPGDKLDYIAAAQGSRSDQQCVAFVGDGINDAPALAKADVGISVFGATHLATQAGDVHLIGRDIDAVPQVFHIARDAVRRIKINLAWAFGYNTVGLTLATIGLLSPMVAAVLMVASSMLIVVTSQEAGDVDGDIETQASAIREDVDRASLQSDGHTPLNASPLA